MYINDIFNLNNLAISNQLYFQITEQPLRVILNRSTYWCGFLSLPFLLLSLSIYQPGHRSPSIGWKESPDSKGQHTG